MKPERTIEHMREQFPMLFHNRSECLNHLFCVVGCGYCWNNGELVEDKDFGDNRKEIDADMDDIPLSLAKISAKDTTACLKVFPSLSFSHLR